MSLPNRFPPRLPGELLHVSDLGLRLRLFDKGPDAVVSSPHRRQGRRNVEISGSTRPARCWPARDRRRRPRQLRRAPSGTADPRPPRPAACPDRHPRAGPGPLRVRHRRSCSGRKAVRLFPGRAAPVPARRARRAVGARCATTAAGQAASRCRPSSSGPTARQFAASWPAGCQPKAVGYRWRASSPRRPTGAGWVELRARPGRQRTPTNSLPLQRRGVPARARMKLELTPATSCLDAQKPLRWACRALPLRRPRRRQPPARRGATRTAAGRTRWPSSCPASEFGDANEDSASRAEAG